ncbi:aminoglycoside phosphotransferase family protein [Actinoplanes utahensis]|uniref:Phosphotransferase n=1 Tax=Actinoplanes utahensis TaxID=1869 RepID=A0A0A6UC12_ACTUT|nr:aminoglycoside phosphotransferase family protein [Actinoplanes utahensis]KHD73600.1 phosphotransferase [Actinoplanes utahensis]GIF33958.1 aminoglycoside phosphotransferase [Actinoplanes utahensis]
MTLHEGEITIGEAGVRQLLEQQCPQWAALPLTPAGAGTENTMYRLGETLLVRLPRTTEKAGALRKETRWLPRLADRLPLRIPSPVYAGSPAGSYPADWAVFTWIDGAEAGPDTVGDWAAFGTDLAGFVRELHRIELGAVRQGGDLSWYRGGELRPCDAWVTRDLAASRPLIGDEQVDGLEEIWRAGLALPSPDRPHVWLHGDLKPTNLLVKDGRLTAVIDFGALSVGLPDAEHATIWDLPAGAREAYRKELDLDEVTWRRARAWAVAVAVSGIAYYWSTFPSFVAECRARVANLLASPERL